LLNQPDKQKIAMRAYYFLRPFFSFSVRKQIRKFQSRNWRELSFPRWPVDRTVESICEELLLLAIKASGADRIPFIWFWPEGAISSLIMTHELDIPRYILPARPASTCFKAAIICASVRLLRDMFIPVSFAKIILSFVRN